MRALSIRQPFAELIMRGVKTVEYRSRPTRLIGERFWIYAAKGAGSPNKPKMWSQDLSMGGDAPPRWMLELVQQVRAMEPDLEKLGEAVAMLPRGVIVGSAVIEKCEPVTMDVGPLTYRWHLRDVRRAEQLVKPAKQPQPVWFTPF